MRNYLVPTATLLLASCAAMGGGLPSFSKLDADSDGKVSRDEAAKSSDLIAFFERADANGDRFLDRTEFQNARELIREELDRERQLERDRQQNSGHQPRRH